MKTCGIIIEYNPMHLGHKYHIEKAREITSCDLVIGVMSPQFVQRGYPAITSKFKRVKAALENGVDIVLELPTFYALQSANYFAKGAIEVLQKLDIDYLVFGSESNDLESLKEISELPINVDKLKERLSLGHSYSMSISDTEFMPNDILAISYLKSVKDTNIIPLSIQRTNNYFENNNEGFVSAHDIRNNPDNTDITKQSLVELNETVNLDKMFDLLKYKLISSTSKELQEIFLVSEGIENHLKNNIALANNYEEFLSLCANRRYTKSRIARICIHILLNHKKEYFKDFQIEKARVLGIKKECLSYLKGKPVGTKIKDFSEQFIRPEINATEIYQLISPEKNLLQQEISKIIIL